MQKYDVILIGAGIVGLATAYNLIKKNPGVKLCIIEKEDVIAKHQTGNNSGVIHSGIYYKPGSLKACGKLIAATNEHELKGMQILYDKGIQNGLKGLRILSKEEAQEIEPYLNCVKAIHVPQTGIIDYSKVTEKIFDILYKHNVTIKLREELKDIDETTDSVTVITNKDDYECKVFVSCAGLQSDRIAKLTNDKVDVRIIPFRGEYFNVKEHKRYLVKHLIYPVPDPDFPFLGVHFTRMITGEVEAGPNAVLAMKREGYGKLDMNLKDMKDTFTWSGFYHITWKHWQTGIYEFYRSLMKYEFVNSLQKLIPEITGKDLEPEGSGVRAQAVDRHGNLIDDFLFSEDKRIINVLNAPSPAATSSLSVGDTISEKIISRL